MAQAVVDQIFVVVGIDGSGRTAEIMRTPSACAAKTFRDASKAVWKAVEVYGRQGLISREDLDQLARAESTH